MIVSYISVKVLKNGREAYEKYHSLDMMISGGINVFPKEVEEVLIQHPSISESAVLGGLMKIRERSRGLCCYKRCE